MYIHEGPNLYLTADKSEVVEEGDSRAAFLLVATGGNLSDEEAKKYKLGEKSSQADRAGQALVEPPEDEQPGVVAPPDDEQKAKAQPANKAKDAPANKSR